MKRIEVTRYIAEDGEEFGTEQECLDYEYNELAQKNLINNFEMYDSEFNLLKKPRYLWSSNFAQSVRQLKEDPVFAYFDFNDIDENLYYVVFKNISDGQYSIIKECFDNLQHTLNTSDLQFPDELGEINVIHWTGYDWSNFDEALKTAKETLGIYDKLQSIKGGK